MSASFLEFATIAASGFDYALEQPLFPGKIILWLLFMLSLLSWAVMVSKAVSLYRMRRADGEFDRQFRAARQPMHLFERNYTDELSMRWLIYEHGAHEAAFQMLGSPDRDSTFEARLKNADGMSDPQMKAVRDAFNRGEEAASARIRLGLPVLSVAAAGAPFLGLLGMVWILMKTFSSSTAAEGMSAVSPGISGGLAVMVVALLVATPAIIGQIVITAKGRERIRQLRGFRDEVARLLEQAYRPGNVDEPSDAKSSAIAAREDIDALLRESDQVMEGTDGEPEPATAPNEVETLAFDDSPANPAPEEDMVQEEMPPAPEIESPFEAVEDGFLVDEPGNDEAVAATEASDQPDEYETPFSEPVINPIAQQTAGILANSSA